MKSGGDNIIETSYHITHFEGGRWVCANECLEFGLEGTCPDHPNDCACIHTLLSTLIVDHQFWNLSIKDHREEAFVDEAGAVAVHTVRSQRIQNKQAIFVIVKNNVPTMLSITTSGTLCCAHCRTGKGPCHHGKMLLSQLKAHLSSDDFDALTGDRESESIPIRPSHQTSNRRLNTEHVISKKPVPPPRMFISPFDPEVNFDESSGEMDMAESWKTYYDYKQPMPQPSTLKYRSQHCPECNGV